MNPINKYTTLFGLLAVEMAVGMPAEYTNLRLGLSALFFLASLVFVWRSFYGMRIRSDESATAPVAPAASGAH
jgi:K(+)-stimulated pyrophosphate-energized sodium pump